MLSRRSQQQPENIGATQRMTLSILEPTRGLLLQKRSKDMRSENAITPSRREFLSDALGIGLITGSSSLSAKIAETLHAPVISVQGGEVSGS